jgi:DNA-binding PadR family transcriptional regulator
MSLRYALLGVLEARPMTGYELAQFFGQSASWVWSAPHSNIYPELRRLESEGLLSSTTDLRGERLERRVYTLTELGLNKLLKWATTEPTPSYLRDPLLIRIGFLDLADPADATAMLRAFIEEQAELIEAWNEHISELESRRAPLLQERLKHRDAIDHDKVVDLKVVAFRGLVETAVARSESARRALEIIERDGSTGTDGAV